ncbi:MAG: LysE family translocator [Marinobacter sp.]|nr:LysE family translocator [Marinobacter sp.]
MTLGLDLPLLLATISFAFVTSATPGPNNLMLLASGANFGFRRTIPHMLGIVLGVALLLALTLAGLGELFMRFPPSQLALQVAGVAYLLWLSWKIATAPVGELSADGETLEARPFRWWQAAAFQFLNPKAWMMALAAISSFTLSGDLYLVSGLMVMVVFALVGLPAISLWAGFGVVIQQLLSSPRRQRAFNLAMGALTAATAVVIVQV